MNSFELKKEIEQKLKESEEKYKNLFEKTPMAILLINFELIIEDCNVSAEALFGYTREELLESNSLKFDNIDPDIKLKLAKSFSKYLKTGVPEQTELQMYRKNGEMIWINAFPIQVNITGKSYVLVMFQDITERKKAEKTIADLARFPSENPNPILRVGEEKIIYTNKAGESIFNIKPGDIIPALIQEGVNEAFNTSELKTIEIEVNDNIYTIDINPIKEEGYANIYGKDITERRKAVDAIKDSEAKFRSVFESKLIGTLFWNAEGAITDANVAFLDMVGYTKDEVLNGIVRWKDMTPPEYLERDQEILKELAINGYVSPFEKEYYHKDGHRIPIILGASTLQGSTVSGVAFVLDITERKKTEEKLKVSEANYRLITESANDIIYVMDDKFNAEYINETPLKKMLGYNRVEFIDNNKTSLPHPDDRKRVLNELLKGSEVGKGRAEFRIRHKDGYYIWVESRGKTFIDGNGEKKIVINMRNISERKAAEQKLKESEEKFRTLAEQSIMGIIIWQEDLVKYANKATAEIADSPLETVEKWLIQDLFNKVHPEDLSLIKENMKEREGNANVELEYFFRIITTSGETRWIYLISKPMIYQGAQATFGLVQDITERKKAEQKALRQTNTIKSINKVFEKALTTETEEELGQICLEVAQELSGAKFGFFGEVNKDGKFDSYAISIPGEDACKMPGSEATKIIKGMEIRGMLFLPLKDGKSRIFNDPSNHPDSVGTPKGHLKITCLLTVPFKYKGKIIGQIGLGNKPGGFNHNDQEAIETLSVAMIEALMKKRVEENIKKSEENLRVSNESLKKAMEELKRSNTELEQFAYVASHDLQEPLRMVASFTQLLQNRYQDKLDDDANDFINYAVDGATRMQNLINDLLIISRVGTRGKPFKTTDMNVVLETVLNTFRQPIKESSTEVTYDSLPVVLADESQMIQLVQNLISNAIKFRGEETPRIHISGEIKADNWIFSVSDNGIGMESKYFDRIFVIFQRLHKKDKYGGTGIGLSVCKKIVQRHSGKIWVESELGKGSTIYFSIPKIKVGQKL